MATSVKKAEVCRVLSWLLGPPDQGLVDALVSGQIHEILSSHLTGGTGSFALEPFEGENNRGMTLEELSAQYRRCFDNPTSEKLLLVESAHKPWTLDPECPLPMAGKKGFVLGDSALHMLDLYRRIGFELPQEFFGWPDHLALELDFLGFLYEQYSHKEVHQFIIDHLDWISNLLEKGEQLELFPLYDATIRTVDYFLRGELPSLSQAAENSGKMEAKSEGPRL